MGKLMIKGREEEEDWEEVHGCGNPLLNSREASLAFGSKVTPTGIRLSGVTGVMGLYAGTVPELVTTGSMGGKAPRGLDRAGRTGGIIEGIANDDVWDVGDVQVSDDFLTAESLLTNRFLLCIKASWLRPGVRLGCMVGEEGSCRVEEELTKGDRGGEHARGAVALAPAFTGACRRPL